MRRSSGPVSRTGRLARHDACLGVWTRPVSARLEIHQQTEVTGIRVQAAGGGVDTTHGPSATSKVLCAVRDSRREFVDMVTCTPRLRASLAGHGIRAREPWLDPIIVSGSAARLCVANRRGELVMARRWIPTNACHAADADFVEGLASHMLNVPVLEPRSR